LASAFSTSVVLHFWRSLFCCPVAPSALGPLSIRPFPFTLPQRRNEAGDVSPGQFHRFRQRFSPRQPGRDRRRIGASRAMRRHVFHSRRRHHPFALRAAEKIHRHFPAREMPALDQRGAAIRLTNYPRGRAKVFRRPDFFPGQNFRLGQVWRHQCGQRQQFPPQRSERVALHEPPSARGDHHRIHHQRNALAPPEKPRHLPHNGRRIEQSGLGRRGPPIGKDRLDLGQNHFGRASFQARNRSGILRRQAGDRAGSMHFQRGKSNQIGLNSRAAAAVRAGDGQRHWLDSM
jgi:hypothetical protein